MKLLKKLCALICILTVWSGGGVLASVSSLQPTFDNTYKIGESIIIYDPNNYTGNVQGKYPHGEYYYQVFQFNKEEIDKAIADGYNIVVTDASSFQGQRCTTSSGGTKTASGVLFTQIPGSQTVASYLNLSDIVAKNYVYYKKEQMYGYHRQQCSYNPSTFKLYIGEFSFAEGIQCWDEGCGIYNRDGDNPVTVEAFYATDYKLLQPANYTVYHYVEQLDGSYKLYATETKNGTVGSTVDLNSIIKSIKGFLKKLISK